MTNNTINNVPRELLDSLLTVIESNGYAADEVEVVDELRALLSAPSPAGVDGLEVVGTLRYFMDYPDSPHSAPGYITHQFNPASWDHAGEAAGEHKLCRLSDAQAIIDGLRGEVAQLQSMLATVSKAGIRVRTDRDQQAQRIGELEGLLREWRRMFDGGLESGQLGVLRGHTDAALSAGKEGE